MGDSSQKVGDMGTVLNKQIKGNRLRGRFSKSKQGDGSLEAAAFRTDIQRSPEGMFRAKER